MNKERARVVIKDDQAKTLLAGGVLNINIPEGAKVLEIRINKPMAERTHSFVDAIDVFFNGRKAR